MVKCRRCGPQRLSQHRGAVNNLRILPSIMVSERRQLSDGALAAGFLPQPAICGAGRSLFHHRAWSAKRICS